jgi:hypothetical protein
MIVFLYNVTLIVVSRTLHLLDLKIEAIVVTLNYAINC